MQEFKVKHIRYVSLQGRKCERLNQICEVKGATSWFVRARLFCENVGATPMKLIPRSVSKLVPLTTKFAISRLKSDIRPLVAFASNPARQRQGKRALAKCQNVRDYLEFTRKYMGPGSVQIPAEIEAVIALIKPTDPRRVCEIGTEGAGTTLLFSRALPSVKVLVGIDLYVKNVVHLRTFAQPGQQIHLLRGSSYTQAMVARLEKVLDGALLDVLFIDGDHNYEGAKQDFLHYRHLVREGGFILFHDIMPDHKTRYGRETGAWAGGVPLLWDRLKQLYQYREFVQDAEQNGLGIGVLIYSPDVELPDELVYSEDDLSAYPKMERHATV